MYECNDCAAECIDKKGMEFCLRLCRECSEACDRCSKTLEINDGDLQHALMECIRACEACAEECEKHRNQACKFCAEKCRECIEECLKMTA
jgi:hypothetical protein